MVIKKIKKEEDKKIEVASEVQITKEESTKNHNKILKNFLIGMGGIIILIFLIIFIINNMTNFKYQGMAIKVVKFCDAKPCLITYNVPLPVIYKGENVTYNFYLRNDPRKIAGDVEFNGKLVFRDVMIINSTSDFNCEGKGIIAVANLVKLYQIARINVIKNDSATCDTEGRYMFVNLQQSNKTSIEEIGPACYNINIKDCEVLEGTERFMIETFVKINEELSKN